MNICILGASGRSGRRLVSAAIDHGHHVTAVLRDPAKLADLAHDRLTVQVTSLSDRAALADVLRGHDVVINAAGYVADGAAYTSLVANVVATVESALGNGGRFWLFGGAALLDVPGTAITTLDLPGIPKIFEAHRTNLERVKRSTLDWSMLCPGPMIPAPNGKVTEALVVSQDVWPVARPSYTHFFPRVALSLAFRHSIPRMTVYYEDAAKVILDNLAGRGPLSLKRVGIALRDERRHKNELDAS